MSVIKVLNFFTNSGSVIIAVSIIFVILPLNKWLDIKLDKILISLSHDNYYNNLYLYHYSYIHLFFYLIHYLLFL